MTLPRGGDLLRPKVGIDCSASKPGLPREPLAIGHQTAQSWNTGLKLSLGCNRVIFVASGIVLFWVEQDEAIHCEQRPE